MQSPSSNDYQPYLYLPLNTNVTLALSTEVSSSKHLQHHIYLEVLLRLKQYLSTTSYLPNYDTPALPPQVTTEKLFDTLLERYQSLYCLSLNIQLPFKSSKMVDYHAFIQDRLMRIPQLQQMMIDTAGLLFMMTKTEHDLVSGLNLNVVLILSNKKQQLAERIIHKFESEFKRLLIDRPFYIHHWGKQLAQDLKKEEIDGGIKLTDKRKIKDYKYWILSFFSMWMMSFNFNISSIIKITISINTGIPLGF